MMTGRILTRAEIRALRIVAGGEPNTGPAPRLETLRKLERLGLIVIRLPILLTPTGRAVIMMRGLVPTSNGRRLIFHLADGGNVVMGEGGRSMIAAPANLLRSFRSRGLARPRGSKRFKKWYGTGLCREVAELIRSDRGSC